MLHKQVIVVTTSDLGENKILRYLKPVSAHVVAGTNVFSDLAASFTDFFGGRSESYQKQLTSLYNEAIERIKIAAFELGANCVLGLKVDIDEISGKNKAMFMITAVGTAVVVENLNKIQVGPLINSKSDIVSVEKINIQKRKNKVIEEARKEYWNPDDELWDFITDNQIEEVYPALVDKLRSFITSMQMDEAKAFYRRLVNYLSNLPDDRKRDLLYLSIFKENEKQTLRNLSAIISELQLLDIKLVNNAIQTYKLENKKKALRMLLYDKPFYNREDLVDFEELKSVINISFKELGTRSTKKTLLSSKEKEVWICVCGQSNDLADEKYCSKCGNDTYGFFQDEVSPEKAIALIDQKVVLINQFLE